MLNRYNTVTYEVSLPHIDGRSLLSFKMDAVGVKQISEFTEDRNENQPKRMQEEDRIRLKHHLDFQYFLHEGIQKKKELTEKVSYVLMFDKGDRQARFRTIHNDIILRKIKAAAPGMKNVKEGDIDVTSRLPFDSEANLKGKHLQKMGVGSL